MNKQQLASKIWESANQMRSKIEANEYKDYILGFIFYKYLSEKIAKFGDSVLEADGLSFVSLDEGSEEGKEMIEAVRRAAEKLADSSAGTLSADDIRSRIGSARHPRSATSRSRATSSSPSVPAPSLSCIGSSSTSR